MSIKLENLCENLKTKLAGKIAEPVLALGEVTIDVAASDYLDVANALRDTPEFGFEQAIDLCGVDYSTYEGWSGKRYGVVTHLLSVKNNVRLRLRAFADSDEFPVVPSIVPVWNAVSWYEREAFDLYGIHFDGHPDLRRILTDYGFVGHPFRKDFPTIGYVEMAYDSEQKRVVYQPVSVELREVTPRVVRGGAHG